MAKVKPIFLARRKVVREKLEQVKVLKAKKSFISMSKERKRLLAYLWRELGITDTNSSSKTSSPSVDKKLPHPRILRPAGIGRSIYQLIQTLSWGPFRQRGAQILAPCDIEQLSKLTGIELSDGVAENGPSICPLDYSILNGIIERSGIKYSLFIWDPRGAMVIEKSDNSERAFSDMVKCFSRTAHRLASCIRDNRCYSLHFPCAALSFSSRWNGNTRFHMYVYSGATTIIKNSREALRFYHTDDLMQNSLDDQNPYHTWIQTAQTGHSTMVLEGGNIQQPGPFFFLSGLKQEQFAAVVISTDDSKTRGATFSRPIEIDCEEEIPSAPAIYQSELLALLVLLQKRIDELSLLRATRPQISFRTQAVAMVINITSTHIRVVEAMIPDFTSNRLAIRLLENKAHGVSPKSSHVALGSEYLAEQAPVQQHLQPQAAGRRSPWCDALCWLFCDVKQN